MLEGQKQSLSGSRKICSWKETSKDNHVKLFNFGGNGHMSEVQAYDSNHPQLNTQSRKRGRKVSELNLEWNKHMEIHTVNTHSS